MIDEVKKLVRRSTRDMSRSELLVYIGQLRNALREKGEDMNEENIVIVSRHKAAIAFINNHLRSIGIDPMKVEVFAEATPQDVFGKRVYGNLPMELAASAYSITAVQYHGQPPRGKEYDIADMEREGAYLATYQVMRVEEDD